MSSNYKKTLNNISQSLLSLGQGLDVDCLEDESVKNITVYTDNFLYTAIDRLSIDYAVTLKYLGKKNFAFFVRKMLLDEGITSPNFNDFSKSFPGYLKSQRDIHDDEILIAISRIDNLWSFEENGFILTFSGMLLFWKETLEEISSENKIDLSKIEKIGIVSINGDNFLKVLETFDV